MKMVWMKCYKKLQASKDKWQEMKQEVIISPTGKHSSHANVTGDVKTEILRPRAMLLRPCREASLRTATDMSVYGI